jgi:hypothetical protein
MGLLVSTLPQYPLQYPLNRTTTATYILDRRLTPIATVTLQQFLYLLSSQWTIRRHGIIEQSQWDVIAIVIAIVIPTTSTTSRPERQGPNIR